jgi:8-oxo-dGTP pyrophosphatase MutT (NUDIX family)
MKEIKTLNQFKYFDVIEVEGMTGLKMNTVGIGILPYTTDEHGMINAVGLLKEYNPFREGDYCHTIITGTVDNKDAALLETAKRELAEEGGYIIGDAEINRWIFLGVFFVDKYSDCQVPTFAVDVTGLKAEEPKTDGSKKERLSQLEFLPTNQIVVTDEALALAAFLRLFNYFYIKTIGNV